MRYVYSILAFICIFIFLPAWAALSIGYDWPRDVIHIYIEAWMLIIGWIGGIGFSVMTAVSWTQYLESKKIQDDTRNIKQRTGSIPSH